ncbi:MAG: PAS domain-containing sensor histidine kinase, partial [Planctomycetota bacterium]
MARKHKAARWRAGPGSKALLDILNDAALLCDPSGRILEVNAAACDRLGYSREDLLKRSLADISPPGNPESTPARLEEVVRKGGMVFETVHVASDGREIPTEVSSRVIEYDGGPAILGIARDITERRRAEELLRASEANYRAIFNSVGVAIFVHDARTGRILDFNEEACDVFGYSAEEMKHLDVDTLGAGEAPYGQADAARWVRKAAQGPPQTVEWRARNKAGELFWVEVNLKIVRIGGRDCVLAALRDITERKKAEEALREEHSFRTGIIEHAAEGLCVCHATAEAPYVAFTVWNDRMTEITGYTLAEINRLGWYQTMYPDPEVRQRAADRMARMRQGDDLRGEEWEIQRADGRKRVLRIATSILETEDGTTHVLGLMEDVTERRRAQEALRLTQFSVDRGMDAAFWIRPDASFLYVNDSACRLLGYSREELLSLTVHDVDPDFPGEAWAEHWAELKEHGALTFESRHRRKDGTLVPVAITTNYVEFEGKEYNFAFSRDITEARQKERMLLQAQKMEAIGRLAGGIAHDFNNQLTVIRGYSDLLLAGIAEGAPWRAEIEEILGATERAHRLTSQLLAFSRKQVLKPEVASLNSILSEMENPLARMIGEDIRLSIIGDPFLGMVKVDRSQFEQAVMNLAVNARDAMPDGGQLTIETANMELDAEYIRHHPEVSAGKYVMLVVSDTGVGMDGKTLGQIFEPFYTTKEVGKGTG